MKHVTRIFSAKRLPVLFVVCWVLSAINMAAGGIIHVPLDQTTIQAGINAASDGDTVLVSDGTYIENIYFKGKAITVASQFLIDGNESHIASTIIDGSQPSHPDSGSVVNFDAGEDTSSVLCGFTITGGTGTIAQTTPIVVRVGGGVNCREAGAKIIHNYIEYNDLTSDADVVAGAGIEADPSDAWIVLKDNRIFNNSVRATSANGAALGAGAGIYCNTRVINNEIAYNSGLNDHGAVWGGGIHLANPMQEPVELIRYVYNNRIHHNKALSPNGTASDGGIGGGLAVSGVPMAHIKNNTISYNSIQSNASANSWCFGAGVILQNQSAETVFENNVVTHNRVLSNSTGVGVGLALWSYDVECNARIINNIIAFNTNGVQGGGVYVGGQIDSYPAFVNNTITNNIAVLGAGMFSNYAHPLIFNSIIWDNSSGIRQVNGTITTFYSNVQGLSMDNIHHNINVDPLFVSGDSLFHLQCTTNISGCLNMGADSVEFKGKWVYAPEHDFGGNARPQPIGTPPDMGVWESDVVNALEELPNGDLPQTFTLLQNFPNPFNPTTNIEFSIPQSEFVTLKIYNLLGQEVATLVSDQLKAGSYNYSWDAGALASGVYLFELQAGEFVETKKMVLLR